MGGMKSGTGDVWGDEDDEEGTEAEAQDGGVDGEDAARPENADMETETTAGTDDHSAEVSTRNDAATGNDAAAGGANDASDASSNQEADASAEQEADANSEQETDASVDGSAQPYVVRRMLKDRSVQFERDERLTFFVHDDVKAGEQELEAETQDLFGRDIPVFDIREAVYRAALRNRDDVVDELETMGYTRE